MRMSQNFAQLQKSDHSTLRDFYTAQHELCYFGGLDDILDLLSH